MLIDDLKPTLFLLIICQIRWER